MGLIFDVALPVFAIMLLGYLAGRAGILGDESSMAQRYGVYEQRSSAIILISTVLSVFTVSGLLAVYV